jgi:hypothetical protein
MIKTYFFSLVLLLIFSCSKKQEQAKETIDKKALADSAQLSLKKKIYQVQIDSVFSTYGFNGSVGIFNDSTEETTDIRILKIK